ncbi:MAG: amidohydrolase family protein, partial [Acidimicrobiales bacterium]
MTVDSVVLTNARLADGSAVDVHVVAGLISAVTEPGQGAAAGQNVHDLCGWLLLPAMAEPHAHLDKALTAEAIPNPTGDLMGAITAWRAAAAAGMFTHDDVVERASAAVELLLVHGVTAVRTHVNVGAGDGCVSIAALREVRRRYQGLIDIQIVALTHVPMTGAEGAGNRAALLEAVEMGVDAVGGAPHLDPDGSTLIANALAVAADAAIGVDLHVDETLDLSALGLRDLARQVQDTGFEHRVAASHCVSLGMQPADVQRAVSAEVAEAGIAVFPLPQTNLFLQGRDNATATPRGLTAVAALQEAGVLVGAGADNVQDPFNLVGRSDPLETAALMVMAGHQLPEVAYDMVSNNVRRAIGLVPVTFEAGSPADLVAIDAPSIRGAIADAPMSWKVFKGG